MVIRGDLKPRWFTPGIVFVAWFTQERTGLSTYNVEKPYQGDHLGMVGIPSGNLT